MELFDPANIFSELITVIIIKVFVFIKNRWLSKKKVNQKLINSKRGSGCDYTKNFQKTKNEVK